MPQLQNGQYFGRFFSYPQGIASFFPTLLSFVAVVANFWMFWDHPAFLCLQVELGSGMSSNYGSDTTTGDYDYDSDSSGRRRRQLQILDHQCRALYITDPTFWDEKDDDMQYAPAQAAAVMAVVAAVAGGIAAAHLASASCFALPPGKLLVVAVVQMVCAAFALGAIFVAAGVDPCQDVSPCERYRLAGMRLEEGSVAAIFAAFFYGWAATVLRYRCEAVRDAQHQGTFPSAPARNSQPEKRVVENVPMIHRNDHNINYDMDSVGDDEYDSDIYTDVEMPAATGQVAGMNEQSPEPSGVYGQSM